MCVVEGEKYTPETQAKLWQQNRYLKSKCKPETKYKIKEDLHLFYPSSKRKGY